MELPDLTPYLGQVTFGGLAGLGAFRCSVTQVATYPLGQRK